MDIIKNRKTFYTVTGTIIAFALISLGVFGLNFGIDFKGGTIFEIDYSGNRPQVSKVEDLLKEEGIQGSTIRPTGDKGYIIRTPHLEQTKRDQFVGALSSGGDTPYEIKRESSIGPTLGSELKGKAVFSIIFVILAIVLFIAFAFRKVSKPVSSWKYGLITIIALLHDVIVPTGAFAILGKFAGAEVDSLFVTALLVILGFSVHDTIVVFDRVRENLRLNEEYNRKEPFEQIVGRSISQTIARSINTSLTTVLTLLALYVFGPETTKFFSLALLIGIIAGTYSSIFLASPLLVTLEKMQSKK